jgi:hypothetical protein
MQKTTAVGFRTDDADMSKFIVIYHKNIGETNGKDMKTIVIEGYGDDTVKIENGICRNIGIRSANNADGVISLVIRDKSGLKVVAVTCSYLPSGTWTFTPQQISDSYPIPRWPIRIMQSQTTTYSLRIEIDVPDDVFVKKIS